MTMGQERTLYTNLNDTTPNLCFRVAKLCD